MFRTLTRTFLLILALQLFAVSAAFAQEDNWTLLGSWINQEYDTSRFFQAKWVFEDNGVLSVYQRVADKSRTKASYVIDDTWTESGIHWFKLREMWGGNETFYYLVKLTDEGNTFEAISAMSDYPAEFKMGVPSLHYMIRHREQ